MLSLWSDDVSTTVRLWSLTDDALVEEGPEPGILTVVTRWGEVVVPDADPVAVEALRRMAFGPVTLRNTLAGGIEAGAGIGRNIRAVHALERMLDRLGCAVVHSLGLPDGQGALLSVEPTVATPQFRPHPVPVDATMRLSRFASLHPARGSLVLETPGAAFRVDLRMPLTRAIVSALVEPADATALAEAVGAPLPVVRDLLSFLLAAGAILVADERGTFAEDVDPDLRGWAQHELQFHQQSRTPVARPEATGAAVPPPVTRAEPDGERFPLYRPDLAEMAASDPTLTALLETDHVCPALTGEAVSARQIGELLFRSARVRSTGPAHVPTAGGGTDHEGSQRPYSNIACLYELELYVTLGHCEGLPRAVYHYDPVGHALVLLDARGETVDAMLDIGKVGAGSTRRPAALVTVTARTGRVSWVLPGAAYAIALMHCGALQETMYLSAKVLGLWAHAVPADAPGVERMLGLPWPAEVAVGECVVDPLPERRR